MRKLHICDILSHQPRGLVDRWSNYDKIWVWISFGRFFPRWKPSQLSKIGIGFQLGKSDDGDGDNDDDNKNDDNKNDDNDNKNDDNGNNNDNDDDNGNDDDDNDNKADDNNDDDN